MNNTMENNNFLTSCIEVPKKHNIIAPHENMPWPFFNTSWEAYKLYCMIVVPRELYKLSKDDEFYKNLVDKNIMRNFNIKKSGKTFKESPAYHFNSLRNSISHDNYTILMQNIRQHNLTYSSNIVPDTNIAQIFVMGPENLVVEIQAKLN